MRPEATASICIRTFGRMSRQVSGKVVFGVGLNVRRKSTGSFLIHNSDCLEAIIMNEHRTIDLVDIPIAGRGGLIWNRLHGERENICETLLKDSGSVSALQERLRKIDDALDRLMSGSYGNCSNCGRSIDDRRLEIDPALALCLNCWSGKP